jgi:L-ascorbate metabolism protein UlaG (beta-lactamase superfamily)
MADIRCDIAFLPCDRAYTMGPEEAVQAAEACKASVVVPVHWGGHSNSRSDAERVAELFSGKVHLLEMGMPS